MKVTFRTLVITLASILVLLIGIISIFEATLPFQITADGKRLVMVEDKATCKAVLKEVLAGYLPEEMTLKSIEVDKDIQVSQISLADFNQRNQVMDKDAAVKYLKSNNEAEEALFDATVTSEIVKEETYTPDIEYHAVDTALAGYVRVESEGKKGKRKVTYSVTSINGKVKSEEVVNTEIIEEGEAPVVYKGTVGVPRGEDWETYIGNAVYNNEEDVVTRALQHLGCPYKYGGRSFANGIDCVWYVVNTYKELGIKVPSRHKDIRKFGTGVSRKNMKKGDIICYKHHVAIYIGNGKMAEATRAKGTKVSKVRGGIITIRRPHKNN